MKNRKGFTIVELVIVIAVIAILAAVLIPTFAGVIAKAEQSAALQTARSTLTNALNMSSTAQLAGKVKDGGYKTVIVVDGYAFGYTGNELEATNYPSSDSTTFLKYDPAYTGQLAQYNSILIATENLVLNESTGSYEIKNVDKIIKKWATDNKVGCTLIEAINNVTKVGDRYYLNYVDGTEPTFDAEILINPDFSNKVVVFTTFG